MVGDITSGLSGADGVFVDKKGNVYAANYIGADVTEYKKGKGSPSCTYSSGVVDPVNVTTDSAGNVYVADYNNGQNPGYIDVFPQCGNTISRQYDVNYGPEGVAVDKSGDLFVAYFGTNYHGFFEEFKSGSSSPTPLGATVGSPGGLILDKNGNLIADDQRGSIDVIAPPYSSATVLVNGLSGPLHCSLNQKENLLFNANDGSSTVTVYTYPSGSLVTTIGTSNGIDYAFGVGESPDAVF
jgi:serine/threonine-protein kinase